MTTYTHCLRCQFCTYMSVALHPDRCDAAMLIHEQYAHSALRFTIAEAIKHTFKET